MNNVPQRRPGDLIINRYLPDADEETREKARDALRAWALLLIRVGDRIEREQAQAAQLDSSESRGRPTI